MKSAAEECSSSPRGTGQLIRNRCRSASCSLDTGVLVPTPGECTDGYTRRRASAGRDR